MSTKMELVLEQTQQSTSHEVSDTIPIYLSFTHCENKDYLKSPTHYPSDVDRTSELYESIHNEDENPARANIKQALGR
ncbi:hypothetical protein Tco_0831406 [Tanacetum coccineum]